MALGESFSAQCRGKMYNAVSGSLWALGRDIVAELRDVIGVRVQRVGSEVIRSEPGEPPRRDSSKLYDSLRSHVQRDSATSAALSVSTDVEYAAWLEEGTGRMEARPWWAVTFGRIGPYIKDKLSDHLSERLSSRGVSEAMGETTSSSSKSATKSKRSTTRGKTSNRRKTHGRSDHQRKRRHR